MSTAADDARLPDEADEYSVAIVGMSGRFPGAPDVEAFGELLREGREGISFFAVDELESPPAGIAADDPRYVRAKGILDDVELFDAGFFDIPGREARWMDPQQRLFLECCWHALEDAGHDPARSAGIVSVYAGVNLNTYLLSRFDQFRLAGATDLFQVMLANEKDHLATRVAYKLDLRGESISVQTSCSTSLVAVHMACQSLLGGQSDLALAGGSSVRVPQKIGYHYQEGLVSSPDGHCRPFDEKAQGTVAGNGVAVVVLKRLADALRDRDQVYAVIRGSAVNNDGYAKAGYTAPSVGGQAEVVARALAMAGVHPDTVGFVEAHGTGTPLGDPIEVEALTRVFRRRTARTGFCALGSAKGNIGHLDAASGVAGLVKAVLTLRAGEIPPTLHFQRANPALRLDESPFFVNAAPLPWPRPEAHPRRAGVSSFGIGGTNAHVVLEEAPARPAAPEPAAPRLFPLSARTPAALEQVAARLADHLAKHPDASPGDVAYTLALGRRAFPVRAAVVADGAEAARAALGRVTATRAAGRAPTAFLFTGQGSQGLGMGAGLLAANPIFRRHFEECAALLAANHGYSLADEVHPAGRGEGRDRRILQPTQGLPALFALEYSLARMWMELGVRPDALIGHSFGEYVAACVAGVYSLEDGLRLAVERGRLMDTLPPGAMLAVHASEAQVQPYLDGGLALATLNGETASVLSGPVDRVEALLERLRGEGLPAQRLPVPFAYHSPLVEPIADACRTLMAGVELRAPTIPLVSNYTGVLITDDEATDPAYWVRQMRHTVRFAQGVAHLRERGVAAFLEVGPGQTLSSLVKRLVDDGRPATVLSSLPHARSRATDAETVLDTLGRLWAAGEEVDWERLYEGEERGRVPLPGYPFERQRYWIEMGQAAPRSAAEVEEEREAVLELSASAPEDAAPAVDRAASGTVYAAPQDEVEHALVGVWEEVLGTAGVGRDDSFYALGGDSLLATQVYSRVFELFPVGLELADVLAAETPAALADRVREARDAGGVSAGRGPIERVPREGDLPMSYVQEWLWSVDQALPGSPAYTFPYAARVRGPLRPADLRAALTAIWTRHEVLRSRYPEVDGRPVQRLEPAGEIDLPLTDLSHLPEPARGERLRTLLVSEARRPFDLQTGPLFRARLVRMGDDDHVVMITMHHIVSDAWSMGIFAHELSLLYPACRDGRPAPLAELPIQYADFAAWQRRATGDERMATLLAYWKRQLAGAPQLLTLPGRGARPEQQSGRGARLSFAFARELTGELKQVAREEGSTLFMVLLAGFYTLLYRESGQREMLVAIPLAGRTRSETEELIGCFINTVAVRADLGGNPRFRGFVQQVRETALAAYAHQELPFEHVVRAVQPRRSAGHAPLVQVLFNFQNFPPRPPLEIDGLSVEPLGADLATAKLDLVVDLWERDEGISGSVEFNTDLYEPAYVERLMKGLEALLADAARNPRARVDSLEVDTGVEKEARAQEKEERALREKKRFEQVKPRAIQVPGGKQ